MPEKNSTFWQNYRGLLFSLGETNVCQLVISQNIWQQAVDEKRIDLLEDNKTMNLAQDEVAELNGFLL